MIYEGENRDIRIIDVNGNFYGDLDFLRAGWYFSEGFLPVETKDGRTGYLNKNGEVAFYVPIVHYGEERLSATDFIGGYALIQTLSDPPMWQVINNKGEFVSDEMPLSWADPFRDGLSRVRLTNGAYTFFKTDGEQLIDLIFDDADSFYQNYARIVYQGRDGLINTKGDIFWSDEIVKTLLPLG